MQHCCRKSAASRDAGLSGSCQVVRNRLQITDQLFASHHDTSNPVIVKKGHACHATPVYGTVLHTEAQSANLTTYNTAARDNCDMHRHEL